MSEKIKEQINNVIDTFINPGLAMHNGAVKLIKLDLEGSPPTVELSFLGGCSGCSSSYTDTLFAIEEILQEETDILDLKVKNAEGNLTHVDNSN